MVTQYAPFDIIAPGADLEAAPFGTSPSTLANLMGNANVVSQQNALTNLKLATGQPVNVLDQLAAGSIDPNSLLGTVGMAGGFPNVSWLNIAKIAGLSAVAGGATAKIAGALNPGEDVSNGNGNGNGGGVVGIAQDVLGGISGLPDWAKALLGAGAGAAATAVGMTVAGGNGGTSVPAVSSTDVAVFGAVPVSAWNTNPAAPAYGQTFFRLSNGQIATFTKSGMLKKWRPKKHIVLSSTPSLSTLLRADKRCAKILHKVDKAIRRRKK